MKQLISKGIILHRVSYGEADRIITVVTPDHGKLHLMAKGVRKLRSKLAGGIELFSVSNISFMRGKGGLGTLTSSRLLSHYGQIAQDVDRTMMGYQIIKQVDKVTEDEPESSWFDLLQASFEALNDKLITLDLIQLWFSMQVLMLNGHAPNMTTAVNGEKLG